MVKTIEELAKIGIGLNDISRILKFSKDKKHHYKHGRAELTVNEFNTVLEESGYKMLTLKKGKKIIIVDEEKEV